MNGIWSFLIALFVLPYLIVPIFIRRNQLFALQPRLRTVMAGFLPTQVNSYFDQLASTFSKLDFEHRLDAVSLDFGPNMRVFMRLFVATKNSVVAIASSLVPDGAREPIRNFVEFSSKFADGSEVSTHNSDLMGAPIEHRQKFTTILPRFEDIETLFAVHLRTVEQLGYRGKSTFMPSAGSELEFLINSFRNDLSRQASLGCLILDKKNNCYRPTWAGAFLIGWYSMWPIGPLLRLWQRLKAKVTLRAFERANA